MVAFARCLAGSSGSVEGRSGRAVCQALLISMGGRDAVVSFSAGIIGPGITGCPAGTAITLLNDKPKVLKFARC